MILKEEIRRLLEEVMDEETLSDNLEGKQLNEASGKVEFPCIVVTNDDYHMFDVAQNILQTFVNPKIKYDELPSDVHDELRDSDRMDRGGAIFSSVFYVGRKPKKSEILKSLPIFEI